MQMWKPMGRCSAQWIFTKCLQDVSKCPWLGSLRESVSECIGLLSRVLPFATVARQASARGVLWARIPEWVAIPSPGDLSDPAIKLRDLEVQADCLPSEALIRYQGDVLSQRKAVWGCRKEGDYQQAVKGGLVRNQLTPLSWTSSLQNLRRKFGCFNHSVWVFFVMAALSHQNSLNGQQQSTSLTIFPSSQIFSQPIFCCKCESSDTSMTRLGPLW